MQVQDVSPRSRVEPFHTTVSGRARIRVPGLYRSALVARQLEKSLRTHPGIHSVRANPRTGNVLVLFDRRLGLEEICRILDSTIETAADSVVSLPR